MASMGLTQARLDSAANRMDELLAAQERRERERLREEAADREREEIDKAGRYTERKREYQALYAGSYRAFNIEPPMPANDELRSRYRRRLYNGLRRKLAPDHDLAMVRRTSSPPSRPLSPTLKRCARAAGREA
jgi:hypothetical protein